MGKCEDMDSIIDLLQKMASQGIPRDSNTFAAALNGCDINGAADLALQLLGEMEEGNFEMNTPIYNSALWACLKGGQWQNTVDLFNIMDKKGIKKDTNSYNAVIWAYENGENSRKAVEMLRLMKFEGLARETISFDGALSALSKAGDWSLLLELLKWMKLDGLEKSYVTYRLAIDTLDKARKYSYIDEIYLESLRSGFYSPWVKKSRQLDLRGFSTALAKVAMKIVLMAIFEGKLAVFTLNITVGDVVASAAEFEESSEIISSLNVDTLIHYLEHFYLESSRPSHVFGEEDSSVPVPGPLVTHDVQEKTLTVQRVIEQSEGEGSVERLIVPREALV
eukprot:gene21838-22815_t